MDLPQLPSSLTRWSVDRHYTAWVDGLRSGGSPAAAADQAHEVLVSQITQAYPGAEIPAYVADLGKGPSAGILEE